MRTPSNVLPDAYRRDDGVLWRRSGKQVVLLPGVSGELFTLDGTGVVLWELLAEPTTLDDAAHLLGEIYGVSPETVAADIEPLLVELVSLSAVSTVLCA